MLELGKVRACMRRKGTDMEPLRLESVGRGSLASCQLLAGEVLLVAAVLVGQFNCSRSICFIFILFSLLCRQPVTIPFILLSYRRLTRRLPETLPLVSPATL